MLSSLVDVELLVWKSLFWDSIAFVFLGFQNSGSKSVSNFINARVDTFTTFFPDSFLDLKNQSSRVVAESIGFLQNFSWISVIEFSFSPQNIEFKQKVFTVFQFKDLQSEVSSFKMFLKTYLLCPSKLTIGDCCYCALQEFWQQILTTLLNCHGPT